MAKVTCPLCNGTFDARAAPPRTQRTVQAALPGVVGYATVAGDVIDKMRALLASDSDARNDYATMRVRYWLAFDGLAEVVPDVEAFERWFCEVATDPRTLWNRCRDVQKADASLAADPDVLEERRKMRRMRRLPGRYS